MVERGQTEGRRRPLLVAPNLVAQAAQGPLGQERGSGPDTGEGVREGRSSSFFAPDYPLLIFQKAKGVGRVDGSWGRISELS